MKNIIWFLGETNFSRTYFSIKLWIINVFRLRIKRSTKKKKVIFRSEWQWYRKFEFGQTSLKRRCIVNQAFHVCIYGCYASTNLVNFILSQTYMFITLYLLWSSCIIKSNFWYYWCTYCALAKFSMWGNSFALVLDPKKWMEIVEPGMLIWGL